jgi:hypothetical protein
VHATVFSELGAVISNMVRFGCPEDEIRSFLDYMCSRSQLTDEQVGGGGLGACVVGRLQKQNVAHLLSFLMIQRDITQLESLS